MAPKGKWAAGITPRNFCWVIKDRLAICERPGGYSSNHRRVRRQEEIIWIREQGFTCVVSLLDSPHNLHNYDELGVTWAHRPFTPGDGAREMLAQLYPELREALAQGGKLILHRNQLDDAVAGLVAGYLLWTRLVPTGPRAISLVEQITHRQLGPVGRRMVGFGRDIPQGRPGARVSLLAGPLGGPPPDASADGSELAAGDEPALAGS